MASPQLENGFTRIANEILEALMLCKISPYERTVIDCVIRKTYGWDKKFDWVSNSQISEMTGIAKSHVTRTVKMLLIKKLVTKDGKKLSLQKDWEQWNVEWRKLPLQVTKVTTTGNKKLPLVVPTKEKKETIQKKLATIVALTEKSMKKNSWKYNESKHQDFEEVIDLDSNEPEVDKEVEASKKVTALMEWGETVRGKKFADKPTQRKFVLDMKRMGISPVVIKQTFNELLHSEYWQQQDRLPDFKTVYSSLKNKK